MNLKFSLESRDQRESNFARNFEVVGKAFGQVPKFLFPSLCYYFDYEISKEFQCNHGQLAMLPVSRHFLPNKKKKTQPTFEHPTLGEGRPYCRAREGKDKTFFAYVAWDKPLWRHAHMSARKKSCEIKLFLQDSYNSSSCANVILCRCTLSQSFVLSFEK